MSTTTRGPETMNFRAEVHRWRFARARLELKACRMLAAKLRELLPLARYVEVYPMFDMDPGYGMEFGNILDADFNVIHSGPLVNGPPYVRADLDLIGEAQEMAGWLDEGGTWEAALVDDEILPRLWQAIAFSDPLTVSESYLEMAREFDRCRYIDLEKALVLRPDGDLQALYGEWLEGL